MGRPAFSLCLCPDSRLLQDRLDTLLAAHPPESGPRAEGAASPWQRLVFWGDEGLGASFWQNLTQQGLFPVPKALVVRNAQNLPAESWKQLSAALAARAKERSHAWPLICLEVGFEKGKAKVPAHIQRLPCYELAEKKGWLDARPGLAPKDMPAFLRTKAASLGLALRPEEFSLLAEGLPLDAGIAHSEMERLALLADAEGRLPPDAVAEATQTQELGIFELMRLVQQNRNKPAVWRRVLEDRLSGEGMVFAFNAVLMREGRVLWQILSGSPPPLPPQAAAAKKTAGEALGHAGIARIWDLALRADKGIKSGERSPEQAFEMLASELFLLFGGTHDGTFSRT